MRLSPISRRRVAPAHPRRRTTAALAALACALGFGPAAPAGAAPPPPTTAAGHIDPGSLAGLSWRSIGPVRGGRSIAVAGSDARPGEYWFGATGGGAWKTTDGGQTWAPVTDRQIASSSVGAVAVCPADPDTVYIGMGEVDLRGNVIPGDGVYRTTDGGAHWAHVGLADSQTVSKLRVDPTDCNRVFAAVLGHPFGPNGERGVFRTTDGGAHWQKMLFRDDLTGAADVVLDPTNPDTVYASLWHVFRTPWLLSSGGEPDGLFKSTDGGDTWTDLSRAPGMPAGPLGKIGITVSPADHNRLYALVEAHEGGLYRSDDAGASWTRVNDSADLTQRAFYYAHVAADPKNRDAVWILNVSLWRSTDGGRTIRRVRTPHGDNHDIWISPTDPNRIAEANDGGGNVSTDGGATWTESDYPTAQFYHVTTTSDVPYVVCGSQQDNSTACMSSAGDGSDFYAVAGGEAGYVAVDPRDPAVTYSGNYGGLIDRFDRRLGGAQARNVNPWPDNPMGHPAKDLKERFQWTFPIVTSPADPKAVYAASQHVFRSTDGGHSWQVISPDLTRADPATLGDSGGPITKDQTSIEYYATVFTIAPSPRDRRVIWAGSDDGLVHVTRDAGRTWADVTPAGLPRFVRMAMVDASHHDTATAYLAAHRYRLDDTTPYLFRTHDGGHTWTPITTGIPAGDFAWTIREDPLRPGLLYAGTQHGVWVSGDDGDHWQSLRLNLPDLSVQDLTVVGDDVVIATHGRGFYVLDGGATLLRQMAAGGGAQAGGGNVLFEPSTVVRAGRDTLDVDYRAASGRLFLQVLTDTGGVLSTQEVDSTPGAHRVHVAHPPEATAAVRLLGAAGQATQPVHVDARPTTLPDNLSEVFGGNGGEEEDEGDQDAAAAAAGTDAGTPGLRVHASAHPPAAPAARFDGGTLFTPADATRSVDRGVDVFYSLDRPATTVTMEFLDGDGTVRTVTGLPSDPGVHQVTWDTRYPGPVTFPGLVLWDASTLGPKAATGTYQVRLTVDGHAATESFRIVKDPRLRNVSDHDIAVQFAFAEQIRNRTSDANQAVVDIRSCRTQVTDRIARAADDQVTSAGNDLAAALTAVEEAVYQTRLRSGQDPLNFPIRLNNKIAALLGVVESADGLPTVQSRQVFDLLSGQLDTQLGTLAGIRAQQVPQFNRLLADRGLAPVDCG
jgi:photosystem II stability/assembly factor-like uncharacterized protein